MDLYDDGNNDDEIYYVKEMLQTGKFQMFLKKLKCGGKIERNENEPMNDARFCVIDFSVLIS